MNKYKGMTGIALLGLGLLLLIVPLFLSNVYEGDEKGNVKGGVKYGFMKYTFFSPSADDLSCEYCDKCINAKLCYKSGPLKKAVVIAVMVACIAAPILLGLGLLSCIMKWKSKALRSVFLISGTLMAILALILLDRNIVRNLNDQPDYVDSPRATMKWPAYMYIGGIVAAAGGAALCLSGK